MNKRKCNSIFSYKNEDILLLASLTNNDQPLRSSDKNSLYGESDIRIQRSEKNTSQ